jgi:peptide/nickel transport system permease protein
VSSPPSGPTPISPVRTAATPIVSSADAVDDARPDPMRERGRIWRFLLFKLGRAVLVLMAATMLTQWVLELAPGGVSATILGDAASPENVARLDEELGLDRPFLVRYFDWAGDVLHGDLGRSPVDNRSVGDAITQALPVTLELVLLATAVALALAVGSAFVAARRPGGVVDRVSGGVTSAALSVPTFVLAPVLLYLLAVQTRVFPVTGWTRISDGFGENLRTALLPAFCVAIPEFAIFQRLFRGDLVSTLDEDYIDAARARGISEGRIMVRHAFRPASISLMTITGISIGRLLGGTVIVETLFVLPGLGSLLQASIVKRDLIMVQGIVVFLAAAYVTINFVVDLLYGVVDPRIRARTQQ